MTAKKIKIESHGISPWHYFLENMSWGFSRKQDNEDMMAFLNVDADFKNGGRGLEDVLMADFLQSLDFADRSLLKAILKAVNGPEMADQAEIRGNAGNYYLPYEDEKNGIRLAQPDGWIADENTLILLEAKGYRKTASLNKGQLAKEFLIAQNVAKNTGRKNFYVMLIVSKNNCELSTEGFSDLWKQNVNELKDFLKEKTKKLLDDKDPKDPEKKQPIMSWEDFSKDDTDTIKKIQSHFLWITWEKIYELSMSFYDKLSESTDAFKRNLYAQIVKTIHFHSTQDVNAEIPLFSQMLAKLAEDKEPLYRFYNGGCGNKTLQMYEDKFLKEIGKENDSSPWTEWHKLVQRDSDCFTELAILEERRRIALSILKQTIKDIKQFYKKSLPQIKVAGTTRKAFEILGESANLPPDNEKTPKFFEQRMEKLFGVGKNDKLKTEGLLLATKD